MATEIKRLNDLAHGRLDAPRLDPRKIIIRAGFNYRDVTSEAAQKHIAWLKESIRERGVDQPIRVEFAESKVFLIDGECRLLALRELWDEGREIYVPAIQGKGDEAEILSKSMIANGSLPPTQLEFGKAAARLLAYGKTVEEIALLAPPHIRLDLKKAKRYVQDAVTLHEAPIAVKEAVAKGVDGVKISPAKAVQAVKKSPLTAATQIASEARQAKAEGKTTLRREKTPGKAAKAREKASSEQDRLLNLGDRMAQIVALESGKTIYPLALVAAAQSWKQLRGK